MWQSVCPHAGFSGEATEWLLNHRDASGLGTECVEVELGWKTNNKVGRERERETNGTNHMCVCVGGGGGGGGSRHLTKWNPR